jgi:pimeloyl-ACP methyl ester carboxylesterase/DNA-binding CsgD family transcriptional regulator
MTVPSRIRQRVHYARASDGVRLAWAESGGGRPIVKASNWLSHLEYEWESPVWSHWMRFFSECGRFVRYDERGCGMSAWNPEGLTLDQFTSDLATVIDAADPDGPVTLLGISMGAPICVAYATRHPERVSRLILYGGYARGKLPRGTSAEREFRAMLELARVGWGRDNPSFRQVFTSRFIPEAAPDQVQWFNDLCRKTITGEVAADLLEARAAVDVSDLLPLVRTPTLVVHPREDEVTPIEEGRRLAEGIPGAEFLELESRNHILLEQEPAWDRFRNAVLEFIGEAGAVRESVFAALSSRERQVLSLMTEGLSNTEIGERLAISEKTVRNHSSNVFDKLGVWSRAQAIVFARDHGFRS